YFATFANSLRAPLICQSHGLYVRHRPGELSRGLPGVSVAMPRWQIRDTRRYSMTTISRRLFLSVPAAAAAAGVLRPAFAMSDAQQLVEKARLAFLDMITDDNYKEMRDYV